MWKGCEGLAQCRAVSSTVAGTLGYRNADPWPGMMGFIVMNGVWEGLYNNEFAATDTAWHETRLHVS